MLEYFDGISCSLAFLVCADTNDSITKVLERPGNDVCTGAEGIGLPGGVFDTTTASLPQFSSAACNVATSSRAMWYFFTATGTSQVTATISNYEFDAVLSVFSGACGELKCEGTEGPEFILFPISPFILYSDYTLSFTATAGTTYYLLVSGENGFGPDGTFRLDVAVRLINVTCCISVTILSPPDNFRIFTRRMVRLRGLLVPHQIQFLDPAQILTQIPTQTHLPYFASQEMR